MENIYIQCCDFVSQKIFSKDKIVLFNCRTFSAEISKWIFFDTSTYLNTLNFHIPSPWWNREEISRVRKVNLRRFLGNSGNGSIASRKSKTAGDTQRAKRRIGIGMKGWDRNGRKGIQIEKVQKVEQIPRISRLVWNQLSLWWRNQCIGGCIRVAKSNLAVSTWHIRGVLGVYIDIYIYSEDSRPNQRC